MALGIDVGAFIGPPVAVRRIRLRQQRRRPRLQHAVIAAVEDIDLPAHLREPGCRHVGADAPIVGEQDARAAHRRRHVDLLDQLPAGIMAEACEVAGGVFLRIANIEAVERAVRLRLQRPGFARCQMPDAGTIGDGARPFPGVGGDADLAAPVGAVFERVPRQSPADGAVAQRHHLVGNAGVDQRLGADDRAGAAGAIDDDGGGGIRRGAAARAAPARRRAR